MKLLDMPFIKLEGVTKADIGKFTGKTIRICDNEIRIGKKIYTVEVEGILRISCDEDITIGKETFKETTPLSVIRKRIIDSDEDAYVVIIENDKLVIILKDQIEAMTAEIPMIWCNRCMALHEPPEHF